MNNYATSFNFLLVETLAYQCIATSCGSVTGSSTIKLTSSLNDVKLDFVSLDQKDGCRVWDTFFPKYLNLLVFLKQFIVSKPLFFLFSFSLMFVCFEFDRLLWTLHSGSLPWVFYTDLPKI